VRTVMVTKFLPLPDDSGGRQRSLAIARRLVAYGELVLCAYDDGRADVKGLRDLGIDVRSVPWRPTPLRVIRGLVASRSLSASRFWSPAFVRQVRTAVEEAPVDLLQVEYLQMSSTVSGLTARHRVLDLHNVESELVASQARSHRGPASLLYRVEASALRAMESRVIGAFDPIVVVSTGERTRLPSGGSTVLVCPNGQEPPVLLPEATAPVVAFVATLGWAPNVQAALWLGREIWPEVLRRLPGARLLLVGRDPAPEVRALATPEIEVTGTVPDVSPFLAQARVVVAPLLAGGGTRLKIMEALGAGRPVVATTIGCDGLQDLVGRGVVLADDTATMVDKITELLADATRATRLGRMGHDAVVESHTWDRALAPLFEAVVP
jgi:glycosyltransferase involved in cell wall biosynthesis